MKKSELKRLIKECIDEVFQEETKPTTNKKTIINRIYKVTQPVTSKIYNDEYWTGLKDLIRAVKSIGYDVSVEKAEYKNNNEGVPARKEYDITIHDKDVEVLKGRITAAFDGTPEDPMQRYDLTLIMW